MLYAAIWPLGRLQSAVSLGQDHFEAALHILEEEDKLNPTPNRDRRALNWNQLLKSAARFANAAAVRAKKSEVVRKRLPRASRDKAFLAAIEPAREWADLELLMRTFKELGAQPLLLRMPVEDIRLAPRLPGARKRSIILVDFLDHLSAKGWLYYDKSLDDLFHNRLSRL